MRPTKYDPSYCERIVSMAQEGKGIAEWADELDVCIQTVRNWMVANPEFLAATKRAATALQSWWERAGRVGMVADKFNSTVWAKNMNCRFPDEWRDVSRQEQTGPNGGPIEHKIQADANAFTSRIAGIASRASEGGGAGSDPRSDQG